MEKMNLPGHEQQPDDISCPACGTFVGALSRCPNCGAAIVKRMSVRLTRYAALILGLLGLVSLYLMSISREIPLVTIGEIDPMMNFAYVRIEGTVNGDVRMFKQGEYVRSLRFFVDDGTGEIPVVAYRSQAEALVKADRVPRAGDKIRVAGSLAVSAEDNITLRLQVPEQLVLDRSEAKTIGVAEVTVDLEGQNVSVEGVIVAVSPPPQGTKKPWKVDVRDDSGTATVSFWQDVYEDVEDKMSLAPGENVRARVSVGSYMGKVQLNLVHGADISFPREARTQKQARKSTAGPAAPRQAKDLVPLAEVTADKVGQTIRVTGRVESIQEPEADTKAPWLVTIREGDVELQVVYWDTVARNLKGAKPVPNALIEVTGKVEEYEGKIQIKVTFSNQIRLVDVRPPSVEPVNPGEAMPPSKVTAKMVGQVLTVAGTLGEPESLKSGVKYPLSEGDGTLTLLLWDRNVTGRNRDSLRPGMRVAVVGTIGEYKGELQIVPASDQAIAIQE